MLAPTFIYFIIGGNPQSGTQEQFYELTPLRIAIGTLTLAILWIGWQTRTSLQTLRSSRTHPTNTITIAAFHRIITGATTIAFSLVLVNIYRATDPFRPAQQPLTYNAHVLTIAAILFLIAAVLLITAAITMFPPSSIAFSAAFAGTGIATGLTITLGGPVGASAAAIVSTGAAAYTYDQAQQQEPDRYQPDQNTNRNTTNDTAQQTKTDDTAANDYNTAQSSREGATRGEAHGDADDG